MLWNGCLIDGLAFVWLCMDETEFHLRTGKPGHPISAELSGKAKFVGCARRCAWWIRTRANSRLGASCAGSRAQDAGATWLWRGFAVNLEGSSGLLGRGIGW